MLPTFIFKVGLSLSLEDGVFDVCKILEDDRVQLESHQDGSIKFTTKHEMLDWYANGKLKPTVETNNAQKQIWEHASRAISTFPEEVQKKAIRKMKYLQKIAEFGPFVSSPEELNPLIEIAATELADPERPSACSVWRWHAALKKSGGDYRVLIDRHDRKGGKATKLKDEIDEMLWACIDDIYMTEERHSIQLVHDELVRRIERRNEKSLDRIEPPSYSTVSRAIKRMDTYEVEKARYGKRLADIRYRYAGRSPTVERVMELVETDHT